MLLTAYCQTGIYSSSGAEDYPLIVTRRLPIMELKGGMLASGSTKGRVSNTTGPELGAFSLRDRRGAGVLRLVVGTCRCVARHSPDRSTRHRGRPFPHDGNGWRGC